MLGAAQLKRLSDSLARLGRPQAGIRVTDTSPFDWLLTEGSVGGSVQEILGEGTKPVRAIFFDKTASMNWALGWHQDRTIAVREHLAAPGFGPITIKSGIPHIEPPFDFIERMITVRIHLDQVDQCNAPLLIALGSHRMGKVAESDIEDAVGRSTQFACHAEPGDVWMYRTAILHASNRATGDRKRRVLQVDYSADALPHGLQWWSAG